MGRVKVGVSEQGTKNALAHKEHLGKANRTKRDQKEVMNKRTREQQRKADQTKRYQDEVKAGSLSEKDGKKKADAQTKARIQKVKAEIAAEKKHERVVKFYW